MTGDRRGTAAAFWWCLDRLATRAVALPPAVLVMTGFAFLMNAGSYRRGVYPADWYDLGFALVCLLPAALGHGIAAVLGSRGPLWWALWLPGIALYWMRPWAGAEGWVLLWMRPAYAWDQAGALALAGWYGVTPPPQVIAVVSGLVLILTAMLAATVRPWFALLDWRRGSGAPADRERAGAGAVEGLPQARWASAREVAESFSHPGGIVLGELTDPIEGTPGFDPLRPRTWKRQGKGALITMDPARGNGHVVVIAASAGGKTAGIVIPSILHYDGPLVVVDPKGDLYARTRDARKAKGYKARVIDAEHGFDPFKVIAPLAPTTPSVYLTMAKTLMPIQGRASDISEYFHEMSCSLFAALMAHYINEKSENVAGDISRFINRERDAVIEEAREIVGRYDLRLINDEMAGLAALDERTFPGVVKGISNKLAFVRFPDVASYGSSTESAGAHLAALDPDTDIFINVPTLAAKDFSAFPRLLIGAMYVASELLEQPERPRARRLFLIDEARVLGGMDALTNVRDAGRSIGMHLMLIYQSLGQMKEAWGGEAGADAWLDSCEARVVGAVGAARTASDIVTMLGRRTLRTTMRGSSSSSPGMSSMGGSVSASEQEQLREVPLMSAATLGQLPAHGSVIFTRRSKPILATKALYFTRADMDAKVLSPDAVVDQLEATKRRRKVMAGIAGQGDEEKSAEEPVRLLPSPALVTPPPKPPVAPATDPVSVPDTHPADASGTTTPAAMNGADTETPSPVPAGDVAPPARQPAESPGQAARDGNAGGAPAAPDDTETGAILPEDITGAAARPDVAQTDALSSGATDASKSAEVSGKQPGDSPAVGTTAAPPAPKKTRRRRGYDADDVRAALDPHVEDLFRTYYGEPERPGTAQWRVRGHSHLTMHVAGERRGQWYDFKSGTGGSLLDFVAIHMCDLPNAGEDFPAVLATAATYAGLGPAESRSRPKARAKARRAKDAARKEEAAREAEDREALVRALRQCAEDVAGTPAETYLRSRAIAEWPDDVLGWLPPLGGLVSEALQRAVHTPGHGALVVWARDDAGTVTGGQRILIRQDGQGTSGTPKKPCFGRIGGCPARFPQDTGRDASATPLVIAEGPETALSVWQAAGHEVWAVFGVTGFAAAPIPLDRPVILAPDQDARGSPAGKTFRRAVAHHLQRGVTLSIARPPERPGSKRDFTDSLQRIGPEGIKAGLAAAHAPGPDDLPDPEDTAGKTPAAAHRKSQEPAQDATQSLAPATEARPEQTSAATRDARGVDQATGPATRVARHAAGPQTAVSGQDQPDTPRVSDPDPSKPRRAQRYPGSINGGNGTRSDD